MDFFSAAIDAVLLFYVGLFASAPPVIGLSLLAAAAGVAMLWVVRKTSNQARIKQVKRAVAASLLELRIFDDEPALTGRALKSLLASNLRYMGLALTPALVMAAPMILLLIHLENFYGHAPLVPGRETTVTLRMAPGWNAASQAPVVATPWQVQITSPPVRVADSREVSWRVLPVAAVSDHLFFHIDGRPVAKRIEAGGHQRFVAERRISSAWARLWSAGERRIPVSAVEWVEIRYPDASLKVFGLEVNWLVWFFVVSIAAALVFKKPLGVVL